MIAAVFRTMADVVTELFVTMSDHTRGRAPVEDSMLEMDSRVLVT